MKQLVENIDAMAKMAAKKRAELDEVSDAAFALGPRDPDGSDDGSDGSELGAADEDDFE